MANDQPDNQAQPEEQHAFFEQSVRSLERILDDVRSASPEERDLMSEDLAQLEAMQEKLRQGEVHILCFGSINVGKSSLINALRAESDAETGPIGGWTTANNRYDWATCSYKVPGLASSKVILVDTPGLNEVDGAERARMAKDAAASADLILFVVADDFMDVQYEALRQLAEARKPIIVVFNKTDTRKPDELERLLAKIRDDRVPKFIKPEDVVAVAANPMPRVRIIERADGSRIEEEFQPPPDIEALQVRMLEILGAEGKALIALNSAVFTSDKADRLIAVKESIRSQQAEKTIRNFAIGKALAVAFNPVPVADIAGGALVDAKMIHSIADIYDCRLSAKQVRSLILEIGKSAGWIAGAEWITHAGSGVLKTLTFGVSTLVTGPMQACAAAVGSYIVGKAAQHYIVHGEGWGKDGAKKVILRIIKDAAVGGKIDDLKDEIKQRIAQNRHAS
ncbi:MAG: hypothetical protein DHS20C16_07030 [Phycisphaerae bacterium]|nr:MAG: hypothetical protein DHS20C16_07030 [Phycisphaerae bacterium]